MTCPRLPRCTEVGKYYTGKPWPPWQPVIRNMCDDCPAWAAFQADKTAENSDENP